MVVAQHLAGIHVLGAYAVFGFYILSGYLMTSILQNNYGYSSVGVSRYALNRFLRIYPMYWVSILLSLFLIIVFGEKFASDYHEAMFIPRDLYEYFKNIFLFFPVVESPRLTPPAWALTVELCFYILIGLGVSRNKTLVVVWLLLSLVYHLAANIFRWGWENIYFSIPAASLPFATGAFIFHFKDSLRQKCRLAEGVRKVSLVLVVFTFILVNWWLGSLNGYERSLCFYINYVLCSVMVFLLSCQNTLPCVPKSIDKWVGDLSYPIYVIHYQVGMLVVAGFGYFGLSYKRPDIYVLLLSLPFIIFTAWLLVVCVERPIENIRSRIRSQNCKSERP